MFLFVCLCVWVGRGGGIGFGLILFVWCLCQCVSGFMFCLVVQFQGKPPVTDLKMVQTLEAVQSTLQVFLNRYPCVQKDLLARLKYIREQFTVSPYFQTHEVGAFPPRHDCHTTDPASLFVPRAGYWQQYFNRLRQYSCWCLDDRLRQDSPPP